MFLVLNYWLGFDLLLKEMDQVLSKLTKKVSFLIPHGRGDIVTTLYTLGHVRSVKHLAQGSLLECEIAAKFIRRYQDFII